MDPDEKVALSVAQRLLKLGLIAESDEESVYYGLLEGRLRESDWRFIAEKAVDNKQKDQEQR